MASYGGFTLGIALVIAMQQLPSVLSSKSVSGPNTLITAWRTIHGAISAGLHWGSLLLMVLTLVVKFGYPKLAHRFKIKIHIPASFVAIIVATLVVQIFSIKTPQIGNLPRSLFAHVSLTASHIGFSALLIGAIQIALLAAIESLLSARVADQMVHIHESALSYKPNRELVGQGLATMVSSMVGGMPATGAIARTSVNIRSKAQRPNLFDYARALSRAGCSRSQPGHCACSSRCTWRGLDRNFLSHREPSEP